MADRQQVRADLVRAAGLQAHRAAACRRAAPRSTSKWVTASRGSSVSVDIRVRTRRSRPSGASIVPRARRRAALDERQVLALDLARPQRGLQRARGPRSERASDAAGRRCRGRAGARSRRARGHRRPPRGRRAPARACRRGARAPGARRRRPACRPRAGARPPRRSRTARGGHVGRRRRRRRLDADHLAAAQRVALGPRRAVDEHAARRRSAAAPRAREPAWLGEEDVEPLARGLRRDAISRRYGSAPRAAALEHVEQREHPERDRRCRRR